MTKSDIIAFYSQQSQSLATTIASHKARNRAFVVGELLTFVLMLASLATYAFTDKGWGLLATAAVMLVGYVVVRHFDGKNSDKVRHLERLKCVYDKELRYHRGDFSAFDMGKQYVDASHDYAFDMDLFGEQSLFQRINRTITTGGSDELARTLADNTPTNVDQVTHHKAAIHELADDVSLRVDFLSLGGTKPIDTTAVLQAFEQVRQMKLPTSVGNKVSLIVAIASLCVMVLLVVLAGLGMMSALAAVLWACLQACLALALCGKALSQIRAILGYTYPSIAAFDQIVERVLQAHLIAHESIQIQATLGQGDDSAQAAIHTLARLLDRLDSRGNVVGLLLTDGLLLSDYFLLRRFVRWHERSLSNMEAWVSAVSRFDALVSLATFRYNEPATIDANLLDYGKVVYRARGIYHPFLGEQAVGNDFDLQDSNYYIITGANMAGKSTFLRALGVNYVLARCGLPVFANELTVSLFSLFSSMRTTDDLSHGISYFNAELLRLKQLLQHCQQSPATLIILDEILRGTNSLDKLEGSRLFLQHVAQLPVTGVIATHDLELSKMADEPSGRFHNYCFEIALDDHITYSYRITPGVARNQNATRLLQSMIQSLEEAPK